MESIVYIDRKTGKREHELVYGAAFIRLLYGNGIFSRSIGRLLSFFAARLPWLSSFYGTLQSLSLSKRKVLPFIEKFNVDINEFAKPPEAFVSFNDFFTRHLKKEARPIAPGDATAIIPADGRYLFYQNIASADGFAVKGKKFDLKTLLQDKKLADEYGQGSMMIARLCPTDYHRFHFPLDCIPDKSKLLNGTLYSVNPTAIKRNVEIFAENKRVITTLNTLQYGKVLFLEIGAVCVGTVHETYTPGTPYLKGDEKGYFSFGGSSLIAIFPPNTIRFDPDLLKASETHTEIRCLMGQSMGTLSSIFL